jgi:20S proteasome alpha/beta subunit
MIVEVRCRYFACFRYYTDPSGTFWQCNAKAIGSGSEGADSSLQEQFNKVIKQD